MSVSVPCYCTFAGPSPYWAPSSSSLWYIAQSGVLVAGTGEQVYVQACIDLPLNSPVPTTVDFYMDVLNTGQTIYLGTVTPNTPLTLTEGFVVHNGGPVCTEQGGFTWNTNIESISAFLTLTLGPGLGPIYGPVEFYAIVDGVKAIPYKITIYLGTSISLSASPSQVYPGQKVTISGQLQQFAGYNRWVGASGQSLFISDYGWVKTDSNGNFSVTVTAPSMPGTYTVKASFYNSGLLWSSESSTSFTVVQPQSSSTTKPTSTTQTTPSTTTTTTAPPSTTTKPKLSSGDIAILLGGAGLLTGITVYKLSKKGKA